MPAAGAAAAGRPALGGGGYAGHAGGMGAQALIQLGGVAATLVWSGVLSVVIVLVVKATVGLRASPEQVDDGLDLTQHGERAFTP